MMTAPLLTTKLHIPAVRASHISRPRLLDQLNQGWTRKLCLISAPAGYGKSTLVSEWIHQLNAPAAWLSLDAYDNDPVRFWTYFEYALDTLLPLGGTKIDHNLLQTYPNPSPDILFSQLIADIARITDRVVLVLDDLHLIDEPQVLDGLLYMLEHLPSAPGGLNLAILTRMDPPWPLARLRVNGEIAEVRAKDLRFTPEEAALLFKDAMDVNLTPDELSELDRRTEGWAAGLQMAALSMQGGTDIAGFLERFSGSHHFVLDYLMEEVLSRQTPQTIEFLTQTSILERLNGPLCDAVTSKEGGQKLLLQYEKSDLFVVALDDERVWYRYHHLFGDLLRKRMGENNPELMTVLHQRASRWYDQAGMPQDAITHALAARDFELAADMLEHHALDLIRRGEMTLTRRWLQSLPEEMVQLRPVLCIAQAWTSVRYTSIETVEDLLAQAEATLQQEGGVQKDFDPNLRELVTRQIAILQVVIARARGESTQRQQELALKALENSVTKDDHASRAWLLFRLGLCYIDLGVDDEADRTFVQAFELGVQNGNDYAAHAASYGRMVIARRHGRLHHLAEICRHTLESRIEGNIQQPPLTGFAWIMLGSLYYEWNRLNEAQRYLEKGLTFAERVGMAEVQIKGYFTLICLKNAIGETGSTGDINKKAELGLPGLRIYAEALQARVNLLQAQTRGDTHALNAAIRWSEKQQLALREQPTFDWEIFEKLIYARVLCTCYQAQPDAKGKTRLEELLDFIRKQIPSLEELDWKGILVEVYAVMAVILQNLDRPDQALSALERSLNLAEPEGFVRIFVDEGEPMRHLLRQYVSTVTGRIYAHKLLSAFEVQPDPPHLIEPLSERELQVLQLLTTHLNVPEIASEIHLAATTVRTHIRNIYRKLDVHGRMEAIQRAEEIGLL